MKIDYISTEGIRASEKVALEKIREAFNNSPFSQQWQGFACFEMVDRVYRDREIDLILLTHDRLIIVELKDWFGKITLMNDHWLRQGNDMGRSAVKVTTDKKKILSAKLKAKIRPPANDVWVDCRVVMCGQSDTSALPADEREWVCDLADFLKITTPGVYKHFFGNPKSVAANKYVSEFRSFFKGPEFHPTKFSFQNFEILGEAVFDHPEHLYKEYQAVKKDDKRRQALLRRWDFSVLAGKADTTDERACIALREQKALSYIHEQDSELDSIVLQPLWFPTRDDVDADFCELYNLPIRQSRLSEFINKYSSVLTRQDRLSLVKVLISHFAALHDIKVAHRDVSDHSVWLERPAKVLISGLISAYFPEAETVGPIRDDVRAADVRFPEDVPGLAEANSSNPFLRDVYLLGVVSNYLLHSKWPARDGALDIYTSPTDGGDPELERASLWLTRALSIVPSERYPDARSMLDALNEIDFGSVHKPGLRFEDFEPFRTNLLPVAVYRIEETIREGEPHVYRSSIGAEAVVVKVWYSQRLDPSRTEQSHRLLQFLEKVRLVKAARSELLPAVHDFGLSPMGPFIVSEWIPGQTLAEYIPCARTTEEGLLVAAKLIAAVTHLHGLGIEHGDISPSNVVITPTGLRLIDLLDLFEEGPLRSCTPAYAPDDYEGIPLQERDCFAVATICRELLSRPGDVDIRRVTAEIAACLDRSFGIYKLDRLEDAIQTVLTPRVDPPKAALSVYSRRAPMAEAMASDNGAFYVGVYGNERFPGSINLSVTGIRKEVSLRLNPETHTVLWVSVRDIYHSDFVRNVRRSKAQLASAEITLMYSESDRAQELAAALLAIPEVRAAVEQLRPTAAVVGVIESSIEVLEPQGSARSLPSIPDIWKSIIEAEEVTLPEIEVSGPPHREEFAHSTVIIPYSTAGEPLDFDPTDKIEVLQKFEGDGEYWRVGELNTKDTTVSNLHIDKASPRIRLKVGDILKLRSHGDRSSFVLRRGAVNRILQRESVIPNLVDYFDPAANSAPQDLDREPTETELDSYNVYEGQHLVFGLNQQQRLAFKRLWAKGPVGLLQGPPGTGKTAFIASFIHYAFSRGARSILLASQSHEAVNNAAEKVVELSQRTRIPIELVRFGAEGMVSDPLRPYHSSAILEAYRTLFRAEVRQRVSVLGTSLGLPREFVESWFDVQFHLERFLSQISGLESRLKVNPEGSTEYRAILTRLQRRTNTFATVAEERFGLSGDLSPSAVVLKLREDLQREYRIRSIDAITRLDQIIKVAAEWIERLAVDRANFEEFLAKTRALVCGTCVGLGRTQLGVAKNRYDWVVVDEAARATPGELAVAIQSGARILLVGDHRQLPPLYKQEVVAHVSQSLGYHDRAALTRSDFQRAFLSPYGREVGVMLQTQYRMAPAIGNLVSDCFYPTPLTPGRGDAPEYYSLAPDRLSATVTWIDTSRAGKAAHDRKNKTHSYDNAFEANEIISLLRSICHAEEFMKALIADTGDDERPMGVICMYADQKRLIQDRFSQQDWASQFRRFVKIDTVDSYQGKQNRIIIVSPTRNNLAYQQGHVESLERVNVSLSRAMDRLVIVGAARMWQQRNRETPLGSVFRFISQSCDTRQYRVIEEAVKRQGTR